MSQKILIIDYGMSNVWSVYSAFRFLGADPFVSDKPEDILTADGLILPGVGSYQKAMLSLRRHRLDELLHEAILVRRKKILGICLGMQLLAEYGTEDGGCDGLKMIPGHVDRFGCDERGLEKVPHIGFNHVYPPSGSVLFSGLPVPSDFYFVHSYRIRTEEASANIAKCCYGVDFIAAYEKENVFATQFHPEKSQTNGLKLLKNFLLV